MEFSIVPDYSFGSVVDGICSILDIPVYTVNTKIKRKGNGFIKGFQARRKMSTPTVVVLPLLHPMEETMMMILTFLVMMMMMKRQQKSKNKD